MKLAITYIILALILTAANIGAQYVVILGYTGAIDILASVVAGTGVGLLVKHVLNKHYIFHVRNAIRDGQTFAQHALMVLATAVIFGGSTPVSSISSKQKRCSTSA